MIKYIILHAFVTTAWQGVVDKKWAYGVSGHAFESRISFLLIYQLENISRSNSKFSSSYGRQTDLKSIFGFYWWVLYGLEKKFSLKYLLIDGGTFVPLLPRRWWLGSCLDWLKQKLEILKKIFFHHRKFLHFFSKILTP